MEGFHLDVDIWNSFLGSLVELREQRWAPYRLKCPNGLSECPYIKIELICNSRTQDLGEANPRRRPLLSCRSCCHSSSPLFAGFQKFRSYIIFVTVEVKTEDQPLSPAQAEGIERHEMPNALDIDRKAFLEAEIDLLGEESAPSG